MAKTPQWRSPRPAAAWRRAQHEALPLSLHDEGVRRAAAASSAGQTRASERVRACHPAPRGRQVLADERTRAKTYLKWLLQQRNGAVFVEDLKERDDVTIVPVPRDAIGLGDASCSLSCARCICGVAVE